MSRPVQHPLHSALACRRAARHPLLSLPALRSAALALLLSAAFAHADKGGERERDQDHDRARAAVQAGEVMPLARLLPMLQRSHPGQVLALELEREDGRWLYELKLLGVDGQLRKLKVDARSGVVLEDRLRRDKSAERSTHDDKLRR